VYRDPAALLDDIQASPIGRLGADAATTAGRRPG
jgi:hypothetical protein